RDVCCWLTARLRSLRQGKKPLAPERPQNFAGRGKTRLGESPAQAGRRGRSPFFVRVNKRRPCRFRPQNKAASSSGCAGVREADRRTPKRQKQVPRRMLAASSLGMTTLNLQQDFAE